MDTSSLAELRRTMDTSSLAELRRTRDKSFVQTLVAEVPKEVSKPQVTKDFNITSNCRRHQIP